jgi:hypothetical protein
MNIETKLALTQDNYRHSSKRSLSVPMASWGNKVEECMDTIVTEAAVSLNPGLLRQDVIVLLFKVS